MRKILKSSLIVVLIAVVASFAVAQELTKEEKRARQKESRKLLKETVKFIEESKFDEALVASDSLIGLDPKNADAYLNKGLALLGKSDSANALQTLEKGSELAPLSTRIKLLLSRLKIANSDIEGAIKDLDFILSVKPKESEALFLRGLIHQKKDETKEALERFKKALESFYAKGK